MSINVFKKKCINFLIEDHAVHYLELHQVDPLSVKKFGKQEIPTGTIHEGRVIDRDEFLHTIKSLVKSLKINKREIQFIVPDSLIVIRKVDIPKAIHMKEIPGYLSIEIGTSIHLPFEDPVFDIHLIQETEEYKEILLFAAPKQVILEYIAIFKEANLKPVVADVSSLALYRMYNKVQESKPEEHVLFVQMGVFSVNATIFHNHKPMFMRHISLDGTDVTRVGREVPGFSKQQVERNLIQEISSDLERIINFYRFTVYQGSERISKIVLIGVELTEVRSVMQEILGLPVEIFENEKIHLVSRANDTKEQILSPVYYITLGLALKEVQ